MKKSLLVLSMFAPALALSQGLASPDTGIGPKQCYRSGSDVLGRCDTTDIGGQDGQLGRDADRTLNGNDDGALGASYTKMCNTGDLAGTGTCPADPAPGDAPDQWACTFDNVTGRTWETKTSTGLRGVSAKYTNYTPQYNPRKQYASATDATGYVDRLNSVGLCGATDWVVEHIAVRQALVDYGRKSTAGARVDTAWLPTLQAGPYWATSDHAPDLQHEWTLDFSDGSTSDADMRDVPHFIHAVRRWVHNAPGARWTYSPDGTEVTDNQAENMVWRRCAEGQAFDGTTCTGAPLRMTHEAALLYAQSQPGWRLPNIKELTWIVEREQFAPALDRAAWPGSPSDVYWTSTPEVRTPKRAWAIDFFHGAGSSSLRSQAHVVRLVHSAG